MRFFITSAGYSPAEDTLQGVREAIAIAKKDLSGHAPKETPFAPNCLVS
jgi:hypothetical protein